MVMFARQRFDFVGYTLLEEVATVKHEFLEGIVWAMAGGSPEHARIAVNISTQLNTQLAGQPCSVFSSDLRVRVKATGLATYPDVTVVCGELEFDPEDPRSQTVTNPRAIVEVLSPSTEDYDRNEKLEHYKQVPSLEAVLLVAHHERRIDVWRRVNDEWGQEVLRNDEVVTLVELECELPLAQVYWDPLAQAALTP